MNHYGRREAARKQWLKGNLVALAIGVAIMVVGLITG